MSFPKAELLNGHTEKTANQESIISTEKKSICKNNYVNPCVY